MPVLWQHPQFYILLTPRRTRGGSHVSCHVSHGSHVSTLAACFAWVLFLLRGTTSCKTYSKTSLTQSDRNDKFWDKYREVKDMRSTEIFRVRDCKKHDRQNGACKVWACNHVNNIAAVATICSMYQTLPLPGSTLWVRRFSVVLSFQHVPSLGLPCHCCPGKKTSALVFHAWEDRRSMSLPEPCKLQNSALWWPTPHICSVT